MVAPRWETQPAVLLHDSVEHPSQSVRLGSSGMKEGGLLMRLPAKSEQTRPLLNSLADSLDYSVELSELVP